MTWSQSKHKLDGKWAFRVQGYCNSGTLGILTLPFHYDVISTECFPFALMPHAQLEELHSVYSTAIKCHETLNFITTAFTLNCEEVVAA